LATAAGNCPSDSLLFAFHTYKHCPEPQSCEIEAPVGRNDEGGFRRSKSGCAWTPSRSAVSDLNFLPIVRPKWARVASQACGVQRSAFGVRRRFVAFNAAQSCEYRTLPQRPEETSMSTVVSRHRGLPCDGDRLSGSIDKGVAQSKIGATTEASEKRQPNGNQN